MSVALTVVTYNRPAYLAQSLDAIKVHLVDRRLVDRVFVVDDGSSEPAKAQCRELEEATPWASFIMMEGNGGVGRAKNVGLRLMLKEGHSWLFLSEDDVVVQSPLAVLGYLGAATSSGLHHLAFHTNRPRNRAPTGTLQRGINAEDRPAVTLWPHSLGDWAVFSAESLRICGLMDERFFNAWEHVEHTMRLGEAGFTTRGMGHFADASGSEKWLAEVPGSWQSSVITQRVDFQRNLSDGLDHWRRFHPETYRWVAQAFQDPEAAARRPAGRDDQRADRQSSPHLTNETPVVDSLWIAARIAGST